MTVTLELSIDDARWTPIDCDPSRIDSRACSLARLD